jgi:uncharacterized integral membrane protein
MTRSTERPGAKERNMANAGMPASGRSGGPVGGRKRSNRDIARIVAAGVCLALLVAFVLDNSQTVKVGFVLFSAHVSLIWVLIITAVLGAAVDRLVILLRARRRSKRARST